MKILGIDPGSRRTGYGVVRLAGTRVTSIAYGALPALEGDLAQRLVAIGTALERVFDEHLPDIVGIEQVFHAKSVRSTLVLGQVRGVCLWLAARRGLPIHEYAPRAVKLSVTGRGGAAKPQVAAMVRRLLELAHTPQADAADALAVALCCARRVGLAARVALPAGAGAGTGPGTDARGAAGRTARATDGTTVDLSRAFAVVKRGAETRAMQALVARRGRRP
jgi:crossover junction endodeoxyribonuclease RuvC